MGPLRKNLGWPQFFQLTDISEVIYVQIMHDTKYRMLQIGEVIQKDDEFREGEEWRPSWLSGCEIVKDDVGFYRRPIKVRNPENIPAHLVPEGWRFVREDEIENGRSLVPIAFMQMYGALRGHLTDLHPSRTPVLQFFTPLTPISQDAEGAKDQTQHDSPGDVPQEPEYTSKEHHLECYKAWQNGAKIEYVNTVSGWKEWKSYDSFPGKQKQIRIKPQPTQEEIDKQAWQEWERRPEVAANVMRCDYIIWKAALEWERSRTQKDPTTQS